MGDDERVQRFAKRERSCSGGRRKHKESSGRETKQKEICKEEEEIRSMKCSRQAIKMHQKLFIKFNSSGIRDRGTACFREQLRMTPVKQDKVRE